MNHKGTASPNWYCQFLKKMFCRKWNIINFNILDIYKIKSNVTKIQNYYWLIIFLLISINCSSHVINIRLSMTNSKWLNELYFQKLEMYQHKYFFFWILILFICLFFFKQLQAFVFYTNLIKKMSRPEIVPGLLK